MTKTYGLLNHIKMSLEVVQNLNLRVWTGHAIAEAVSSWLPRVRARVWQVGFVADKVASG
jgi:hypothetical protein